MPLVSTDAIILHSFRYGETSKIVRLLTRDHGPQSVIAKGAMNPKSKFGARLQSLSEGVAQFFFKPTRDLHTLREFDVVVQRQEIARDPRRFSASAALAEVIMRFAPAEPHPEIYELVAEMLGELGVVSPDDLAALSIAGLWTAIAVLGFEPSIGQCARDGEPIPPGSARFSVSDGGFLCPMCARGAQVRTLKPEDRHVLEMLIAGHPAEVGQMEPKRARAHRRLLVQFVERHVAEGRELPALTIWQSLS
jgi:DNA repair protein RecO (recombination protein O)